MIRCCAVTVGVLIAMYCLHTKSVSAAPTYELTGLEWPGWRESYVNGINNNGQIVGTYNVEGDSWPAFLYSKAGVTSLGPLGLCQGINDRGQIVGGYGDFFDGAERAYVYSDNHMTDLGIVGDANDINASGQIVGAQIIGSSRHAFLYSGETLTDLGTLPGKTNSSAGCINAGGQVAGWSYNLGSSATGHAFLYSQGSMTDLGTLGGTSSIAYCINATGLIVGRSDTPGDFARHATLWTGETMIDLGTLTGMDSTALGINASGQIVGHSTYTSTSAGYHAFLYSGGTMQDLNNAIAPAPGWVLRSAEAINDSGWIIGNGSYYGRDMAFLLTPIPEPSALVLLGIGAIGLLGYAWRWRC